MICCSILSFIKFEKNFYSFLFRFFQFIILIYYITSFIILILSFINFFKLWNRFSKMFCKFHIFNSTKNIWATNNFRSVFKGFWTTKILLFCRKYWHPQYELNHRPINQFSYSNSFFIGRLLLIIIHRWYNYWYYYYKFWLSFLL